jgi:hypothetical protein
MSHPNHNLANEYKLFWRDGLMFDEAGITEEMINQWVKESRKQRLEIEKIRKNWEEAYKISHETMAARMDI